MMFTVTNDSNDLDACHNTEYSIVPFAIASVRGVSAASCFNAMVILACFLCIKTRGLLIFVA